MDSYSVLFDHLEKKVALTPEDKENLLTHSVHRRYLKGQFLVQQGDVCVYENFVVKGCLKTFHVDRDGNEHVTMFATEGWWTADLGSLVSGEPADFNVQCLEPVEVIRFSAEQLEILYGKIPVLNKYFRIMLQNAYVTSQRRIAGNLSLSAQERYQRFLNDYPGLSQRVPQYLIASYLGITKEFLSTLRNRMMQEDH